MILEFKMEFDDIPSENFLYKPAINYSGKRPFPYLYKVPEVVEFQDKIVTHIKGLDLSIIPPRDVVKGITSCWVFGLHPDRYWERDTTNMVKAVEDAVFTGLGSEWDDSQVTISTSRKVPSEQYFIYCQLRFLQINDVDINSTIDMLHGIKYFNDY